MGLVDASSKSEATDSRQGAGDNSLIQRGTGYTYAAPGAVSLGRNAKLSTLDLTGASTGNINLTNAPPELFEALSALSAQNSRDLTTLASNQNDTLTGQFGESLAAISDLAANAQTGGESSRNKTVLYIVLAVLAAVAVIFVFGKD